ncbi:secreted protein [Bathymodiolus azoricus thioautotrophic gill symbiont]|uniref:Secreted protein n=1 Tax=Bathymodiolus azoricus thioautotrophic gill symbiont TaxID=235205 RepID=A0A1H6LR63_9GAMM|nr:secreted protein [Bathymodiolus azoricus thioautotrophic gill symbiont]
MVLSASTCISCNCLALMSSCANKMESFNIFSISLSLNP